MKIKHFKPIASLLVICLIMTINGCENESDSIAPREDSPEFSKSIVKSFSKTAVKSSGEDWVMNPINKHYYRLTEYLNWFEAEELAQQWGGHLVTINNSSEEAWLISKFGSIGLFWIGFNDLDQEGVWIWTSGEVVTYTNWDLGEPNNTGGTPIGPENAAILFWCSEIGDYRWNDIPEMLQAHGVVERTISEVSIDIKPGSDTNPINLKSKGLIPVAILSTSNFDPTMVDPQTVRFGPDKASVAHKSGHIEDVDGDGDLDLLLHFKAKQSGIDGLDTEIILIGETYDGVSFFGTDIITIVPPK